MIGTPDSVTGRLRGVAGRYGANRGTDGDQLLGTVAHANEMEAQRLLCQEVMPRLREEGARGAVWFRREWQVLKQTAGM